MRGNRLILKASWNNAPLPDRPAVRSDKGRHWHEDMSDERTSGIILRTFPLTETSLVVRWLTSDLGRIATVARGALRLKSPFRGKLDLFFLADFTFRRNRRSELHALREIVIRDFNTVLREDLTCLREATYFGQLIEKTTETDTPLPDLFQLFQSALIELATCPSRILTVIAFESRFLTHMGLSPNLATADLTAGSKRILDQIACSDWIDLRRLHLSGSQSTELTHFFLEHLTYHFGSIPKGRSVLMKELGN